MVTLTMPHTKENLGVQLAKLRRGFSALRRTPFWRKSVSGGYAFVEVTHNPTAGEWHPHFHLVLWATFVDYTRFSEEWSKALDVSLAITWIAEVKNNEGASSYVTKYLKKGADASVFRDPEVLREYELHTRHCHFATSFGIPPHTIAVVAAAVATGAEKQKARKSKEVDHWVPVAGFLTTWWAARAGHPASIALLEKFPYIASWLEKGPDP
jgi:hypothetical protein